MEHLAQTMTKFEWSPRMIIYIKLLHDQQIH